MTDDLRFDAATCRAILKIEDRVELVDRHHRMSGSRAVELGSDIKAWERLVKLVQDGSLLDRRVVIQANRYVPSPPSPHEHGHMEIVTIPAPPKSEYVPGDMPPGGGAFKDPYHRLRMACNHCLKDIEIHFPMDDRTIAMSFELYLEMADTARRTSLRVQRELHDQYQKNVEPQLAVKRYAEAYEEWSA